MKRLSILAISLAFGHVQAVACPSAKTEPRLQLYERADIVFRGRPVRMEPVGSPPIRGLFILEFETVNTYRGAYVPTRKIIGVKTWSGVGDLAGFVKIYGDDVILATTASGPTLGRTSDFQSGTIADLRSQLAQLPWLLQVPCAPPIMFRADSSGIATMKLKGLIPDDGP